MNALCYSAMRDRDLLRSENEIVATEFANLEQIDTAFFGPAGPRDDPREQRIKTWIAQWVEPRATASKKTWYGRTFTRFPRQEFKQQFAKEFGSVSVLLILYYLAIAIWWWRKWRRG